MIEETDKIKDRYTKRDQNKISYNSGYSGRIVKERNEIYLYCLKNKFNDFSKIKILEIGAGNGGNIEFFKSIGCKPENIYANELIKERIQNLVKSHPDIHVFPGDALEINETEKFDVIFQSTVFTSILDDAFRVKLAQKMIRLLKKDGIILWYDFIYNNPKNKDVKKVSFSELRNLFENGKISYSKKVTLAPPIGRRVGKLYSFFNIFGFLRSHLVAVIENK